jgi:hypothetical protein
MPSGSSPRRGRHFPDHTGGGTPATNGNGDWPAQAADTIERVVGSVRDKTTGPAITIARGIVYGTFALVVGTVVAVLVAIAAVRALDNYLPDSVFGEEHTWAAHLLVGLVFTGLGMVMWSRRSAPPSAD